MDLFSRPITQTIQPEMDMLYKPFHYQILDLICAHIRADIGLFSTIFRAYIGHLNSDYLWASCKPVNKVIYWAYSEAV